MTPIRFLLVILLLVSFISNAQDDIPVDKACKNLLLKADNAFEQNKYTEAITFYLKSEVICSNFKLQDYTHLIASLKNAINGETEKVRKTAFIDSLVGVFERCEAKSFYDQSNDVNRATFILKSSKPNYLKVDELFTRAFLNEKDAYSETSITLYYFNLYTIYTQAAIEKKSLLKKRLIDDYFRFTLVIDELRMSEQTSQNVSAYFHNVIRSCEDLVPDITKYLKVLPTDENQKITDLTNLKTVLELKKCTESEVYAAVVDSLLIIEPSSDLYLALAEHLRAKKEYSKEFSALYFAKKLTKDESSIVEIDFLSLKSLFSAKNYSEAWRVALTVRGKYFGEANKIAAQSVALSNESCGTNALEQRLNLYYAFSLAKIAKEAGADVQNLISNYSANFLTSEELTKIALKKGQQVALKCWGIQIIIPE